ncbi:MAG: hypothetical protein ABIH92_03235 [Nanoarchaeota archaeon]
MVFGSIADILFQWEYLGVFDFILPFLLIFAIVFGILTSTKFLGDNKPVCVIVAIVIGLMSIRYSDVFFSAFLSELFPRLGVGLAIVLTLLILVGMFIAKDERRYWGYGLAAIGFVIALSVFYQSTSSLGWTWGGYGTETVGWIVLGVLMAGVIIAVAVAGGRDRNNRTPGRGDIAFLPGVGWGKD